MSSEMPTPPPASDEGMVTPHVADASTTGAHESLFEELFAETAIEEWSQHATRRGPRIAWPVLVTSALLLVLGGMGLGSYLQRTRAASPSSFFSRFAGSGRSALGPFAGGFAGVGAGASSAPPAVAGVVTDVIGRTLYVTTSTGALVKVEVSSTTRVTRTSTTSLAGLVAGNSVSVQGSTSTGGVIEATSVTATGQPSGG